jgi:DNA-binding transcriptional LysR family regulator
MPDKQESIDGMAALVATVRAGSFSRAALCLGMTPSGASKLVARLEQRLGVQLLKRTTRSMQLTEAGELYYARAAHVLEAIDGLERDLEDHHRHPRGRVALTAPTVLGSHLVMPVVIAFQRSYPDVAVDLDLTDRVVDLVAEGFDIAIRLTDRPPESCVARKLGDDVRALCASPSYVRKHGRPERPGDLASHHCITFMTPNGPAAWHLRRDSDGPVEPHTFSSSLSLNNATAVHQAALAGLGIGDLPLYMVEDQLATGRLVSLLGPYVPVRRTIYAIYAASRLLPAKTRAFLKVLEASFQTRHPGAIDDDIELAPDPVRVVA